MSDTEKEVHRCPRCGYFDHDVQILDAPPAEEVKVEEVKTGDGEQAGDPPAEEVKTGDQS